jgi:hypothetical protein
MDGVGMDKSNLETEKTVARRSVDQLGARAGQVTQRSADIVHAICDMVHSGAALGEELAYRRVRPSRCKQLDSALADEHGRRLDTLIQQLVAMFQPTAEEPLVRVDRLVEIDDGKSEVVDTARFHRARS